MTVQIRLARDRNEHVEGLRELSEVELMLDDQRINLFTVKSPLPARTTPLSIRILNARITVKAGPHVLAVTFPQEGCSAT